MGNGSRQVAVGVDARAMDSQLHASVTGRAVFRGKRYYGTGSRRRVAARRRVLFVMKFFRPNGCLADSNTPCTPPAAMADEDANSTNEFEELAA